MDADGQISTNDLILNVNDISFENIGNGEAARILQEIAQKPGSIKLVVGELAHLQNKYKINIIYYAEVKFVFLWLMHHGGRTTP